MGRISEFKLTLSLIVLFLNFNAFANNIVVEPNNPQKTLKKAFENAENGDTIIIKEGTYQEGELYLNKRVTIVGEGLPIIDGEHKHENLLIEHDSIKISGVKFINSGSSNFNDIAALKIKNSDYVHIDNCVFENNFFGIHTLNSNYITYTDNLLKSGGIEGKASANGIHCWKSNHLTILNNKIEGHRDGIYLEFVNHSHIEDNITTDNKRYGMHFMFAHDNVFVKNKFTHNGAGVAVMYSKRVTMKNNLFSFNWGNAAYGLLLKEMDDSEMIGNVFSENTMGVYADGANRVHMQDNQFLKNGWAIKINASSADAFVSNNNFIGNTFDIATNGNWKAKSLDGNYWDKYEGYDLDRNGIGDIPYRPITFYSLIIEKNSAALMLFRSFFVKLMDKAESVFPSMTPEDIMDNEPKMKKIKTLA